MKSSIQNRRTIAFMILCIGMLGVSGLLFWNYGMLKIRVAFTSEQTRIFDEMQTKALQSTTAEAVGCLDYVLTYEQTLPRIWEPARTNGFENTAQNSGHVFSQFFALLD